jgi:hypothetical protein
MPHDLICHEISNDILLNLPLEEVEKYRDIRLLEADTRISSSPVIASQTKRNVKKISHTLR